jgi:NADH-quinone oxidoreductase subunit N
VTEFDFVKSIPAVAPEIGLTLLALIVLALDVGFFGIPSLTESRKRFIPCVAALGLAGLAIVPFVFAPESNGLYWGGMVRHDTLSQVFTVMILLAASITSLTASALRDFERKSELYILIIVSTLGATLMSASADLIMVFVALETTTIPLYILAAFRKDHMESQESGMKYFLFGSFASAIMLYGFSLLYGFTGHTNIYEIASFLGSAEFGDHAIPTLVAMAFVFAGFGFKISAVPFHFWTPDVYEGAPTPVTAFISVASKAASFALLIRFFIAVIPNGLVIEGQVIQDFWVQLAAALAVISMVLGNALALSQKNIKRLLAYSSIAQAGYALIGVAAIQSQSDQGVAAVAFYMFMYTFTNLLAFGVVALFGEATGSETIADLAGLNRRSPWMALAMTIGLLSLGGIPPAAGFFGKFFLFNAAVEAHMEWLAIIGVLNAIVALYYYLVVIKVMYVDRSEDDDKPILLTRTGGWVLGICAIAVILLGVMPTAVFDWARDGAQALGLGLL